ncbi:MAG: hypothetical protein KGV57_03325 [Fusobacterium sp.]|nr:hypothetical protein [Fusobacterium sp.]
MKNMFRYLLLIGILFAISVVLFVTGQRHEIYIYNNTSEVVKYSINGADYKKIKAKKKIKTMAKGLNNNIYFKNIDDKVIDKDLVGKDIEILVKEAFEGSEDWYKERKE